MKYEELFKKYRNLLKENERLKRENSLYHKQYGPILVYEDNTQKEIIDDESGGPDNLSSNNKRTEDFLGVNRYSKPEEKIRLFMALFAGRRDVYAYRWESRSGKTGYSPACKNEWIKGVCEKPRVKCANCENREFAELNEEVIVKHLMGKEIIGVYPMLSDETCSFLAIDFDEGEWQRDVLAVRQVCNENNISVYIERSRSGNGAHLWFFFDEKIPAYLVRKFGTALLTYTMNRRHELSLNSYDRLFPNQDTIPKGGFGNLIALPLQKAARAEGNSVFVDENFEPYEDQWAYLHDIEKLSFVDIEQKIKKFSNNHELGIFGAYSTEEKSWEKKAIPAVFTNNDFPECVNIVKANMLYIKKEGISHKALNRIKRLAAFKNPEFYKAQAMRLPTYNKPRIISLAEETEQYLCIPRGCEEELNKILSENAIEVNFIDERNTGRIIDVDFNGQLREEQKTAAEKLLKYETGILSAATAFGKTVIGARLISERKVNTLILVHTRQLLEQWQARLEEFLIINHELPSVKKKRGRLKKRSIIGQIGAGKNTLHGIVDVGIMQSLVKKGEVNDLVKDYGMIIVDECHHVAAFSYEQILKTVSARYVYGLTATPLRQDGQHPITFMCCGNIRHNISPRVQAEKRPFDHFVIPRISPAKLPLSDEEKAATPIYKVFAYLVENQKRNNLITKDILSSLDEGRNILVLTERTAHVQNLFDMLENKVKNIFILTGRMSAKNRSETMEKLHNIPDSENVLLIATGKYIGEGFDYPRLDTLFLTFPVSWKGRLQQYAGRLHRLYEGKNDVLIYDYVDINISVLDKMYQKRLKGYASLGYKVKSESADGSNINIIFDNNNFLSALTADIAAASREIYIASPFISKRKTDQMLKLLAEPVQNDIKVIILTKPVQDFKEKQRARIAEMHKMIKAAGIELVSRNQLYQKFIIIDNRIVWYGSLSLLSYGRKQESIMRLDSREIAYDLHDTVKDDV